MLETINKMRRSTLQLELTDQHISYSKEQRALNFELHIRDTPDLVNQFEPGADWTQLRSPMATSKEQAQAALRRLESELAAAKEVLRVHLKTEKEDLARGYDKVSPARSAVTNAERAVGIARSDLSRLR
jgi:hypothetical protein